MQYAVALGKSIFLSIIIQRIVLILIWLFLLYLVHKKNKPVFLLLAVIALGSFSIIFDMSFMKSSYGLHEGGNTDRHAYLAQAMTYAVGNPFNEDFAVKGIPALMSPFFPYFIGILHKILHIAIARIYDYSAVLWTTLVPIFFYFFGAPITDKKNDVIARRWIGTLMACFALYLSSDPMDLRFFREDFWNCLVLLKPDHSLSFCLIPLFYYLLQKKVNFKNTLLGGLVLGLIILTWATNGIFLICGLSIYIIFILIWHRREFWKVFFQLNFIVVIAIIVSSYWWSGFLYKDVAGGAFTPGSTLFKYDNIIFDPFESTFFMLPLFVTGLIGIYFMLRRKARGDLILLGFITTMYFGKLFVYPISIYFFKYGPQAFECSVFMIRFGMAMASGIGIYEILHRLPDILNTKTFKFLFQKSVSFGSLVSLFLLCISPYLIPIWQVPQLNSKWYAGAKPIESSLSHYAEWIKRNTAFNSVFLCDGPTSLWTAALTGRKVVKENDTVRSFVVNYSQRKSDIKAIYESRKIDKNILSLFRKYEIDYVVIHPRVYTEFPNTYTAKFKENPNLFEKLYNANGFTVYKIRKNP